MNPSQTTVRPESIDLNRSDDPRDVVHKTVASLAQGEGVIFSLEGWTGLAASALHDSAVDRLVSAVAVDDGNGLPILLLRTADELADWVPSLTPAGFRLSARGWPGVLTLVFPVPREPSLFHRLPDRVGAYLREPDSLAFQVPAHPFVRDVLGLLPGPVVFRQLSRGNGSIEEMAAENGFGLIVESNPTRTGDDPTVVRVDPTGWSVLRPGSLDEASLTRLSGTILLFVCTGNTCRSPMAEAICKVLLAERLGCAVGELESRGYVVLSAGIAAVSGMPAASNAIDVVKGRGGSLAQHVSRKLTLDLVHHADAILAMTGDHLDALLEHVPEVSPKCRLLHPQGHDVADPVGADRDTYQRTANAIETYLKSLLDSLGV